MKTYQDSSGWRAEVTRDDGTTVTFHQAGGGFQCKLPAARFHDIFTEAPPLTWRRGTVTAEFLQDDGEGEVALPCWSDGSLWNGWGMPYFERATIDQLKAAGVGPCNWDGENVVTFEDGEFCLYEPRTMPDGSLAWGLGAGGWTWDSVKFNEE